MLIITLLDIGLKNSVITTTRLSIPIYPHSGYTGLFRMLDLPHSGYTGLFRMLVVQQGDIIARG